MSVTAIVVIILVFAIVAVVFFGIFEITPFAHHTNPYRDARNGKRLWESPHLETRDEFEHRTQESLES